MKSIQRSMLLLLGLFVSNLAIGHANIGVFDVNRALFETEAWQAKLQELEQEFSEEQTTLVELNQELEELFLNIDTNAPTLTETALQRLREEGQFKQLRIQQIGERVESSLREAQSTFVERYRQTLSNAINEVFEEGGYDLILRSESVIVSGFTYDVTSEVIVKLNEFISVTN